MTVVSRKGDMGNETALILRKIDRGQHSLRASGSKNEIGEYRFVEFTTSGTNSPETLKALTTLRHALELYAKQNRRGVISYETESGCLQMRRDADGDEYIRTIGLDDEVCDVVLSAQNTSLTIRDSITDLFTAMRNDERRRPQ